MLKNFRLQSDYVGSSKIQLKNLRKSSLTQRSLSIDLSNPSFSETSHFSLTFHHSLDGENSNYVSNSKTFTPKMLYGSTERTHWA